MEFYEIIMVRDTVVIVSLIEKIIASSATAKYAVFSFEGQTTTY